MSLSVDNFECSSAELVEFTSRETCDRDRVKLQQGAGRLNSRSKMISVEREDVRSARAQNFAKRFARWARG